MKTSLKYFFNKRKQMWIEKGICESLENKSLKQNLILFYRRTTK